MKSCRRATYGCSQKNPQPISCFTKNKNKKDDLEPSCKSCCAYKRTKGRYGVPPSKRPVEEGMKWCSRWDEGCSQKNPQPISRFYKNKHMKNGLYPQCISCRAYKRRDGVLPPWKRPVEEGMKWCSRSDEGCSQKNPQPIFCFHKNERMKDGLNLYCRSCRTYQNSKRTGRVVGVKSASARPPLSLEDAQPVAVRRVGVKGYVHLQPSSSSSSSSSDESDESEESNESDESEASSSCMNLSNVLRTKKVLHL